MLILLLSVVFRAHSQTITAASCNSSDVQAAFNAVTISTTTVNIPAGTCTWATQVTLSVPTGSTTLSVFGAGSLTTTGGGDQTIIVDNIASNNAPLLIVTGSSSSLFRMAGITFEGGSGLVKYGGVIGVSGNSQNIRFDHSHIKTTTYNPANASAGFRLQGCTGGVADHNIVDNPSGSVSNSIVEDNGGTCYNDAVGQGDQSWAHSTSLGTSNFFYMENNVFNNGVSNDCTFGGRFVARFNTYNMTSPAPSVQTHPTVGGRTRGCRAWEVYQNTFNAASGNYMNAVFFVSSGTGVFWGNTIPSSSASGGTGYGSVIQLHSMRRDNTTYTESAPPAGWGYCGTSFNGSGSNWDQNTNISTGYHCMDQPGQGIGDLLTGGFTSDGSGSNNVTNSATACAYGSSCASPREAQEPIYEWTDNYSLVPNNPSQLLNDTSSGTAFFNNTDYYLWCNASSQSGCTSFTGTTGVGSGMLAARPSTCTIGVAYWATDQGSWNQSGSGGQGELFKCTATNTWTLFYTPYTYPHPLTVTGLAPSPPTNVQAMPQ
jgi:hypothetical protein